MTTDKFKNRFVIDESPTEIEWLRLFGPLATEGMGGLFPERSDLSGIHKVLDLGCGPGEWVLSLAGQYPDIEVYGIDVSQAMLDEAASHARARGYDNAHFLRMDITHPLEFDDNAFDLINARTIVGIMNPVLWVQLLKESLRILKPGGIYRDTEFSEGLTNSAAAGTLWGFGAKGFSISGRTFDPDGRHIGIINQLPRLLRDAGFQNIDLKAHPIEHSAGTPAWEGWYKNYILVWRLLKPFLLAIKVTTDEEFERLIQQAQGEMLADTFTALEIYLTVWGEKPL